MVNRRNKISSSTGGGDDDSFAIRMTCNGDRAGSLYIIHSSSGVAIKSSCAAAAAGIMTGVIVGVAARPVMTENAG